jgi:hypothetical protein
MLSKKNKESRILADGVVGKYVKRDIPSVVPSKKLCIIIKLSKKNLFG